MAITYKDFNPNMSTAVASTTNVEFTFYDDGDVCVELESPDGGMSTAFITLPELMELCVGMQDWLNKRK